MTRQNMLISSDAGALPRIRSVAFRTSLRASGQRRPECLEGKTRRLLPPGLLSWGSKRDVIVVNELAVLVLGLLRAAQEVDRLGDDLAAVAVYARAVGPLGVVDAAPHQNLHAFLAMLLDRLAETIEAGDAVPFGILDAVAVFVAENPAFGVARPRGRQGESGDCGVALGCAGFQGLTDVAGEDYDVLHFTVSVASTGGIAPPMMPGKDRRERSARGPWHPPDPQGRDVVRAGAETRQHGSRAAGVAGRNRTGLGDQSGGGTEPFGGAPSETEHQNNILAGSVADRRQPTTWACSALTAHLSPRKNLFRPGCSRSNGKPVRTNAPLAAENKERRIRIA